MKTCLLYFVSVECISESGQAHRWMLPHPHGGKEEEVELMDS